MSRVCRFGIVFAALAVMFLLSVAENGTFRSAQAAEPNPTAVYIQRTMKALEESTAENPATVRVLFYGQSIVAQEWTAQVQKFLQEKYPTVKFTFENKAIGGFTSPALIWTAESDLYPWYPDLLFFHVYGDIGKYEGIVAKTRATTTAEIILWTSHLSDNQDAKAMIEERDQRSKDILAVAERQKAMVIDLNKKWCRLLLDNGWATQELLRDSVHLKPEGCRYYADFITEELVRIPGESGRPDVSGTIREVGLDDPAVTKNPDGSLTLSFEGNRVCAVSDGKGDENASADLLLDDEPMNGRSELWATTRPSKGPMWMPAINTVSWEKTPVKEDWTLTAIEGSAKDGSFIKYRVEGSVTGPDGEGNSKERFVSNSGRVVIEPSDIGLSWQLKYMKKELPDPFTVTWSYYPLFADPLLPAAAGERTVLVQNSENGPHRLTIRPKNGAIGIGGFIVYAPAK